MVEKTRNNRILLRCHLNRKPDLDCYIKCELPRNPLWRVFYAEGFGVKKDQILCLTLFEAIYLMKLKKLMITDEKKELEIGELLGLLKGRDFFQYLAYQELRKLHYPVKIRFLKMSPYFEIFPRNSTTTLEQSFAYAEVVLAGEALNMNRVSELLKLAEKNEKKMLIVVIDELGDMTIYEVSQVLLEETKLKIT